MILFKKHILDNRKGFTLTETIVAMSLFTVCIIIAIGSFVRALRSERALINLMSVNSNTSITLEQMAREIRTGYDFSVSDEEPPSCVLGGEIIDFTNTKGNLVTYKKLGPEIVRMECALRDCSASSFSPLTASDVAVRKICFIAIQADESRDPWRITTVLEAGSPDPDLSSNFIRLQTTVSSRVLPSDLAP